MFVCGEARRGRARVACSTVVTHTHIHVCINESLQESKDSYQREKQMQRAREAQFIDECKRAILLDGGYVKSLGPEVVFVRVGVVRVYILQHVFQK